MAVFAERLTSDNSLVDLVILADPEHYRMVELPRKIGFDKVTVSLRVEHIDWEMLEVIETSEAGRARTLSLRSCRIEEKILSICSGEPPQHWYSEIRIQLASNIFTMRKCNLPGCRDICLFEICIPPIEGHECLGNINNLSCEQEQLRVQYMMDELERYGIYTDREFAELKNVEINVNLFLVEKNVDFRDAVEMLRPHRHGLRNFTFSDYAAKSNDREYYISLDSYRYELLGIKERQKTSFNSTGKSLVVKIYDKSVETLDKSKGFIEWISPITRIEFSITSSNLIPYYFGKVNLFELVQEDVETAFHRLSDKFIRQPLIEFYRKINMGFEKYFENIDITEHAWRKNLVMELDNTIKRTDDFYILPYEDLKRLVSLIPAISIKKNRARIADSLKEEFLKRGATCIRIVDGWDIGYLLDWLCGHCGEEAQSIIYCTRDMEDEGE